MFTYVYLYSVRGRAVGTLIAPGAKMYHPFARVSFERRAKTRVSVDFINGRPNECGAGRATETAESLIVR